MTSLLNSLEWLQITDILPDGEEPCACIAVSHPSRCYVTAGGMVTHNSDTSTAADKLPERPRRLLDAMLGGTPLEEAAHVAGMPVDRIHDIRRNLGRFLQNEWAKNGITVDDGIRQLQQRAMEHSPEPLESAPRARDEESGAGAAGWFYNHIDRFVTRQASALAHAMQHSAVGQFTGRALARLAGVGDRFIPFFEGARKLLSRQAVPMQFVPTEAKALLREMQIRSAFGKEMAMDVYRSLSGRSKFSDLGYPPGFADRPADKKRLYLAMTGHVALDSLPEPLQQLAGKLRGLLLDAGREAVRLGRMSAETFANLQENYLPHYYADEKQQTGIIARAKRLLGLHDITAQRSTAWHVEDTERKDPMSPGQHALVTYDERGKRWRFNSEQHRDAFYEDFIREQAVNLLQNDREVTHLIAAAPRADKSALRAELKGLTREGLEQREKLSEGARGVIRQAMNRMRSRYARRAPQTVEQHEKAGLIFDPVYSVVRYLATMTHDNAVAELFNAVADNRNWTSDSAAVGFKQIPDTRSFGRLAGKFVAEPIADQLTAIAGQESPAMEIYDDLMRAWSSGKTVYNPGTHVRNFLGNFMFANLSGTSIHNPLNWKYYREAFKRLRDGGDDLKELYEQGVLGGDFSSAELKAALRELMPDAAMMNDEPPARLLARLGRALLGKLPERIGRTATKGAAFANAVYKSTDDFFKAACYIKARDMGMSPEEAAAHTRKWNPFYDHIGSSSAIKFARRIHPFLSFGIEAARILKNAVRERPIALASSMIAPYVLTLASMNLLGLSSDDQNEVLKDMRGKLKFKGMTGDWPAFSILLPMRSEGKLTQFDLSNVMPFAGLLGRPLESGQEGDFAQYLAKQLITGSPLMNLPVAIGMNRDPFNDRNLVEQDMSPGEKAMKRAQYVWNMIAPPLAGGTAFQQVMEGGQRTTNKTLEKRNSAQTIMRAVFGLDVRNATPNLYRMAEDFRKSHGIERDEVFGGGTTAQQRARQEIFGQLAQDRPDENVIAKHLRSLAESGHPISTTNDINKLLFHKNPLFLIKGADKQAQFHYGTQGEARATLEDALAEFRHIQAKAPAVLARARALMLQQGPVTNKKLVSALPMPR